LQAAAPANNFFSASSSSLSERPYSVRSAQLAFEDAPENLNVSLTSLARILTGRAESTRSTATTSVSRPSKEYAKSPENTLVVSPDNRSRTEINERIHTALQRGGLVSNDEHSIRMLVPRQDLTGADRTWAERYQVGGVLR
jgi:hypothetical protein